MNETVALGATESSHSYGSTECSGDGADQSGYFNHRGVAITESAGDGGSSVEFLAASQYVAAVGGTTLNSTGSHAYQSEAAWSSTGSGCST